MNNKEYEYRPKVRSQGSSKPRTADRPTFSDAQEGFVVEAHMGRWVVVLANSTRLWCVRARELGKYSIVVGDTVYVTGDTSGAEGTFGRIIKIAPRNHVLRRSADDTDPNERIVVAGCDQLLIIVSTHNPHPKAGFIYRSLIASYTGNITPIIGITKTDEFPATEIYDYLYGLDVASCRVGADSDLSDCHKLLSGHTTALVGQSGVGKSTLVNRIIPHAHRVTNSVSAIGKGKHTSSTSIAFPLPDQGWIIDTPGIRSLGLAHITIDEITQSFPDLAPYLSHDPHENEDLEPRISRRLAIISRLINDLQLS